MVTTKSLSNRKELYNRSYDYPIKAKIIHRKVIRNGKRIYKLHGMLRIINGK